MTTVAWIQDRWLTRARDELGLDDLFDVIEILEAEYHALYERPRPPTGMDWLPEEARKLVGLNALAERRPEEAEMPSLN